MIIILLYQSLSRASRAMIAFPLITIIPIGFDCVSTASSRTRFMNGSNPLTTPLMTLEPFKRTNVLVSNCNHCLDQTSELKFYDSLT